MDRGTKIALCVVAALGLLASLGDDPTAENIDATDASDATQDEKYDAALAYVKRKATDKAAKEQAEYEARKAAIFAEQEAKLTQAEADAIAAAAARGGRPPAKAQWILEREERLKPKCDAAWAESQAKKATKASLHDPKSLRNWNVDVSLISGGPCLFRVQATFTATNGFGGRVRGTVASDIYAERVDGGYKAQIITFDVK